MLTGSKYLNGCSIYTTLEPCAMCAAAISLSRIDSLYYGLNDPKSGAVEAGPQIFFHPQTHHKPTVYAGFLEDEIAELMKTFFWALRKKKKNDKQKFFLEKNFKFKNFLSSQEFVNEVGKISELENHHPDISFGWGYAKISITTHAIEGLSENDFILAAKIDEISNV